MQSCRFLATHGAMRALTFPSWPKFLVVFMFSGSRSRDILRQHAARLRGAFSGIVSRISHKVPRETDPCYLKAETGSLLDSPPDLYRNSVGHVKLTHVVGLFSGHDRI